MSRSCLIVWAKRLLPVAAFEYIEAANDKGSIACLALLPFSIPEFP